MTKTTDELKPCPFDKRRLIMQALEMYGMINEEQLMRTVKAMRALNMSPDEEPRTPSITVQELEGMKKKYVSAEYGLACEDTASFNEKAREYNAALQAVIERISDDTR